MRFGTAAVLAVVTSLAALPCTASAEDAGPSKELFDRGLADMMAGRYDAGCPALAESYKLDPRPGTLFTLAECQAKRGRIATALELYDDYLSQVARLPPDKQEQQARRKVIATDQRASLAPRVPQLTLTLPAGAPPGTTVTRDGAAVAPAALGLALPVDPGEHVVTVKAPDGPPLEIRVTLAAGDERQLALPRPPGPPLFGPRRIAAVASAGLGVAGLLVGVITGGLTLAKKSVIQAHCDFPGDAYGCDATGLAAARSAKSLSVASTVGLVVGAAGVGAGAAFFFTEPRRSPSRATALGAGVLTAGPDATTFGVRGAW